MNWYQVIRPYDDKRLGDVFEAEGTVRNLMLVTLGHLRHLDVAVDSGKPGEDRQAEGEDLLVAGGDAVRGGNGRSGSRGGKGRRAGSEA